MTPLFRVAASMPPMLNNRPFRRLPAPISGGLTLPEQQTGAGGGTSISTGSAMAEHRVLIPKVVGSTPTRSVSLAARKGQRNIVDDGYAESARVDAIRSVGARSQPAQKERAGIGAPTRQRLSTGGACRHPLPANTVGKLAGGFTFSLRRHRGGGIRLAHAQLSPDRAAWNPHTARGSTVAPEVNGQSR